MFRGSVKGKGYPLHCTAFLLHIHSCASRCAFTFQLECTFDVVAESCPVLPDHGFVSDLEIVVEVVAVFRLSEALYVVVENVLIISSNGCSSG